MGVPHATSGRPSLESEQSGERIGRYKLLQQIGEGGFGTVWMAEQVEPVTRRVALKIIKLGMDTQRGHRALRGGAAGAGDDGSSEHREGLRRRRDGQRAAVLRHGTGEGHADHAVLRRAAARHARAAGACSRDVCSAIKHAHQKGVIHRDIKPSNVMVTLHGDKPVVKVIDFGIAKATQGRLTDKTLFTRFEQFIGTPAYMSPEQAAISGLDIDTRSDIYALGVLLYELLTGKPPFDAKSLALRRLRGNAAHHPRSRAAEALVAPQHRRRRGAHDARQSAGTSSRRNSAAWSSRTSTGS